MAPYYLLNHRPKIFRLFRFATLFTPILITSPLLYCTLTRHTWLKLLVSAIKLSGPAIIKLGQWLGTRSDLLPLDVCIAFSTLHQDAMAHPLSESVDEVTRLFSKPIGAVFSEFSSHPVGVGAIGQVHSATLAMQKVAVKVVHPNVAIQIRQDLSILKSCANILVSMIPSLAWLSLSDEIRIFSQMMIAQLDLTTEAKNLATFRSNFGQKGPIGFPKPLYCNENVLVESYIDAVPLNMFLRYGSPVFNAQIAKMGLNAFLKMLLIDNHIHADMHPGNIFVGFNANNQPVSTHELEVAKSKEEFSQVLETFDRKGYTPCLYIIDAGLQWSLSVQSKLNLIDLFVAIVNFDGPEIANLMVSRSEHPELVINRQQFQTKIQSFISKVQKETLNLGSFSVSDILSFVFTTVQEHHVKIDGQYANIAVGLMVIEGIGRQLDPNMDLINASIPYLKRAFMSKEYLQCALSRNFK
jgi:aarF domain-containing kinase